MLYQKKKLVLLALLPLLYTCIFSFSVKRAFAMPFYDLQPCEPCLRAEFYTSYPSSSPERKHNISLAVKSINGYLVDVGGEFSFNRVVGARTVNRGYKKAKIIVGGTFVDGVGGGVCQVSTTLYNAVLLSGLTVNEYHPHSLQVSYVSPSFDAMVNSNNADLRFTNNTHNPIIIFASCDGVKLKVSIYGEPMKEKYIRQSVVKEYISPPREEVIFDNKLEYPTLYQGERLILSYPKQGLKSEGALIKQINGKTVGYKKIRSDTYRAIPSRVIVGMAIPPEELTLES